MTHGTKTAAIGAARVRWLSAPLFLFHAARALDAARAAPGCVFAGTNYRHGQAFSLTVWNSPADMKAYAKSRLHARAVRWAWVTAEVSQFHFFPVTSLPTWDEAITRWLLDQEIRANQLVPGANP